MITSFKYICPPGTGMLRKLELIMMFMAISTAVRASFLTVSRDLLMKRILLDEFGKLIIMQI